MVFKFRGSLIESGPTRTQPEIVTDAERQHFPRFPSVGIWQIYMQKMQKYAKVSKLCKHEFHMQNKQNMHPTLAC